MVSFTSAPVVSIASYLYVGMVAAPYGKNPKSEYRNPKQIRIRKPEIRNSKSESKSRNPKLEIRKKPESENRNSKSEANPKSKPENKPASNSLRLNQDPTHSDLR